MADYPAPSGATALDTDGHDYLAAGKIQSALLETARAIERIDADTLALALVLLRQAQRGTANVFVVGNGGSAANAAHLAEDLQGVGIRATALDSTPALTMTGNDYGFAQLYARPVALFAEPGDVLIALTCSGMSPNVVQAVAVARAQHMYVIGLLSQLAPSDLVNACDVAHIAPSQDYGVIESAHLAACHALVEALRV